MPIPIGYETSGCRSADAVIERDLVARVGDHPGVEHAAGVFGLPLDDTFRASSSFTRAGETDNAAL
jgi:hypothetical protein